MEAAYFSETSVFIYKGFKVLGTFPCKPNILRKRFRKAVINGVKVRYQKCGENRVKVK